MMMVPHHTIFCGQFFNECHGSQNSSKHNTTKDPSINKMRDKNSVASVSSMVPPFPSKCAAAAATALLPCPCGRCKGGTGILLVLLLLVGPNARCKVKAKPCVTANDERS